jgi:type IV pilus assembly protein PilY1
MNASRGTALAVLGLSICLAVAPFRAAADDIDIFVGSSGISADVPNIIFLVDNSPNWSRAAQKWPGGGVQGTSELAAISSVLNQITSSQPANVGLAMLTSYAGTSTGGSTPGTGGGYIRFGVRDMTNAANRAALQNILAAINVNDPAEKLSGQAAKDEDAAFYEIYKYLSGLAPFTGPYGISYAKQNGKVDVAGNSDPYSGAGQGLTSGFALASGIYQTPLTSSKPCARTYIIYIANNAQGGPTAGDIGRAYYQQTVADADPRLAATSGWDSWTDEWTKFLYMNGVVVPAGNNNGSVVTYILDAYNAQQNVSYSNSLVNAAKMGGGKYFQVGSQGAIVAALAQILDEIQSVNSSFASASLPVNTTNRAQNDNQVFIPLFRPDPSANPRWMGNVRQYQIIDLNGQTDLGDASNPPINAVNPLTGFLTSCATSFWTTDSGTYWSIVPESPIPKGTCPTTSYSPYSDAPDGPIVEKGGVAEVIRKGNSPPTTNTTPSWAINRTVYTLSGLSGTSLTPFTTASSGLPSTLVDWILGHDVLDENGNSNTTESRPSLHGDEIHSRPTPVDYGGSTGVTVYYGSNDGTLRAVDATTGRERWAFIAPEFYTPAPAVPPATPTGLARLMYDIPYVSYPGFANTNVTPTPVAKDYYFDGSIGLYQAPSNSSVFIYPTMRRGGRMMYALDVTDPGSPVFKWKAGCPYLTNDTGCTTGMSGMGQTWSSPMPATKIQGYSGPVVIVGGGYDRCEDANSSAPACSSPKGAAIYVLDANTGVVLKTFATTRSVAADVALIGIADPNVVDHAYAVDTGGNIYRIDFGASVAGWSMNRVAYTNGSGRKFLYAPALVAVPGGQVYLALGSGDREHPLQSQYPYSSVLNRFYVYRDNLSSTNATNLDDTTVMFDYTAATGCSTTEVLPSASMKGWFMNLNQYGQGEQTVTSAIVVGGLVYFSTNRPIPATQGTCSTVLGEARGYVVNLFNASGAIGVAGACGGGRTGLFIDGGLPASPVVATIPVPVIDANTTVWQTIIIGGMQRSPGGANGGNGSGSSVPKCDNWCTQNGTPPVPPTRHQVFWKSSGQN